MYAYCGNDPINGLDPQGLFFGKLFGWIGKAFKWIFRVAAVIVAVIAVVAATAVGQYWGSILITKGVVALLFGSSALLATAGWAPGKIGQIAGAIITAGLSWGSNFRTPTTFPQGTGVGGVSNFIKRKARERPRKLPSFGSIAGRFHAIYDSASEAAEGALDAYNPVSRRENREYGGNICETTINLNGSPQFIYTAKRGTVDSVEPNEVPCPLGTRRVRAWHTHGGHDPHFGTGSEIFSPDDKLWSNNNYATGVDAFYVATPNRRIKVFFPAGVPGTESGTIYTYPRTRRLTR